MRCYNMNLMFWKVSLLADHVSLESAEKTNKQEKQTNKQTNWEISKKLTRFQNRSNTNIGTILVQKIASGLEF